MLCLSWLAMIRRVGGILMKYRHVFALGRRELGVYVSSR